MKSYKKEAHPNEKVTYEVVEFNQKDVAENDKKRIHWQVKVDGKKAKEFLRHGEKLELTIKEEWTGKEIIVMPYLVKPYEKKVSKKRKIIKCFLPRVLIQTKTYEGFGMTGCDNLKTN